MVGSSLSITFLETGNGEGFYDWFWERIAVMNSGYLSWIDQSGSDPDIGSKIWNERWDHKRKTAIAFQQIPMGTNGMWTAVIEGHEIAKIW
jgi:hypothetical protein